MGGRESLLFFEEISWIREGSSCFAVVKFIDHSEKQNPIHYLLRENDFNYKDCSFTSLLEKKVGGLLSNDAIYSRKLPVFCEWILEVNRLKDTPRAPPNAAAIQEHTASL